MANLTYRQLRAKYPLAFLALKEVNDKHQVVIYMDKSIHYSCSWNHTKQGSFFWQKLMQGGKSNITWCKLQHPELFLTDCNVIDVTEPILTEPHGNPIPMQILLMT